jgi:hypothetical protein
MLRRHRQFWHTARARPPNSAQFPLAAILQPPGRTWWTTLTKYARYVVTAVWVIAGGWLMGTTANAARSAWLVVPKPPEVLRDVTVRNVKDEEGLRASFRILLFSDESAGGSTRMTRSSNTANARSSRPR